MGEENKSGKFGRECGKNASGLRWLHFFFYLELKCPANILFYVTDDKM
jgi:hypothetical protein